MSSFSRFSIGGFEFFTLSSVRKKWFTTDKTKVNNGQDVFMPSADSNVSRYLLSNHPCLTLLATENIGRATLILGGGGGGGPVPLLSTGGIFLVEITACLGGTIIARDFSSSAFFAGMFVQPNNSENHFVPIWSQKGLSSAPKTRYRLEIKQGTTVRHSLTCT